LLSAVYFEMDFISCFLNLKRKRDVIIVRNLGNQIS